MLGSTTILKNIHDIVTWGLGGLLTTLIPIFLKMIRRTDFRDFVKQGLKVFILALFNRVEIAHRLFYNADKYKAMANRISFTGEKLKTELFHILLITKIDTVTDLIKDWMKDKDNIKLLNSNNGKMPLQAALTLLLEDIVEAYEARIKENYFKHIENRKVANYLFDISYNGVCLPECHKFKKTGVRCDDWCERTIGFKFYHERNIDFINRFIESIPESEGERNSIVFSYFLNTIDNALYAAVYDAKKVFEKQNGRYKVNLD